MCNATFRRNYVYKFKCNDNELRYVGYKNHRYVFHTEAFLTTDSEFLHIPRSCALGFLNEIKKDRWCGDPEGVKSFRKPKQQIKTPLFVEGHFYIFKYHNDIEHKFFVCYRYAMEFTGCDTKGDYVFSLNHIDGKEGSFYREYQVLDRKVLGTPRMPEFTEIPKEEL